MVREKIDKTRQDAPSDNPFCVTKEASKYAFLDSMSEAELEMVLRLYFPVIKLARRTYMVGLERHDIKTKDERLFIKTLVGYISLDVVIGLDCIDDCLVLAKTINDLLKPFKQVVSLHLKGHRASAEVIKEYEESQDLD